MFDQTVQAPVGLSVPYERRRVIARGRSFVRGEIGQFDIARASASTLNFTEGSINSCLTNVVEVTDAGAKRFPLVVFEENVTQDQPGWAVISGVVEAFSADSVAAGAALMGASANNYLNAADDDGAKVVAVALESISANARGRVLFNGMGVLGVHVN